MQYFILNMFCESDVSFNRDRVKDLETIIYSEILAGISYFCLPKLTTLSNSDLMFVGGWILSN
jgi:hypothetical protein